MAERLTAFLYDRLPDTQLAEAARAGRLGTTGGVLCEARRMLAEPRARQGVARLFERWLGVWNSAGAGAEPSIPAAERSKLEQATRAFVLDTFFHGALADLYTSDRGAPGEGRAGLLTEPLVLLRSAAGMRTAPGMRGVWISDKLLCRPAPPEPGAPSIVAEANPPQPVRVIIEASASGDNCAACHQLVDPFGFALEHFDALGNFRNEDDFGFAIDASGRAATSRAGSILVFDGARELGQALASSSDARDCAAQSLLEAALASFGGASFEAALAQARRALAENVGDLPEFAAELSINPAFLATSLASDVCGEAPSGCRSTGCAAGLSCNRSKDQCLPSSCRCDWSTRTWNCAFDCDGGVCGVGGGCSAPDPGGCISDLNCADGQRCAATDGACIPRGCVCDPSEGTWTCASDCGGGSCVPR